MQNKTLLAFLDDVYEDLELWYPKLRVEAAGYGDSRPIVPNDSEANRAKNRRIEFRVLTH